MKCERCGAETADPAGACPTCVAQQAPGTQPDAPPAVRPVGAGWDVVIVLMMAGVLFALLLPRLLNEIQRDKQKRTTGDIRTVRTAVNAYAVENNEYPRTSSMDELHGLLEPTFVKTLPTNDAWGRPIEYRSTNGQDYTVRSAGKDGEWEFADPAAGPPASVNVLPKDLNCDIVFGSGGFVVWPEGQGNPASISVPPAASGGPR